MSCKALTELLKRNKRSIEFVFVASCHSKLVGDVFFQAGAKHVICIKRDEKILDECCHAFTREFYHAYFSGSHTICEAFKTARSFLEANPKFPKNEAFKFEILKTEDIFEPHECSRFVSEIQGSLVDMS